MTDRLRAVAWAAFWALLWLAVLAVALLCAFGDLAIAHWWAWWTQS